MGGSAFSAALSASAFPRLPRPVYRALKARLLPTLNEIYTLVGVPVEAPEKTDHGDLDLLVSLPKPPHITFVPHEVIKRAIGAEHVIAMDGNRTSNYAVPIQPGEWGAFGNASEEQDRRNASDDGKIYYQVDVHACLDKNEWDRILFYHSYGDLGMILGLIARNNGLSLGLKGLNIPNPPDPPFELSNSFDEVIQFLGLSLPAFNAGFKTKHEVFEWAVSQKYFDPKRFRFNGPGITKVKEERKMYAEFVEWVKETKPRSPSHTDLSTEGRVAQVRKEALVFFKKNVEFDALALMRANKLKLKKNFSGSCVRDWAELGEYWKGVKLIMDEVRRRFGGEEGILKFLEENDADDLKAIVLEVRDSLGLLPHYNVGVASVTNQLGRTTLNSSEGPGKTSNA